MDFYKLRQKTVKKGLLKVYPDFVVGKINDLMIRGGSFYAVWDEERKMWSTDESDVVRLIDNDLSGYYEFAKDRFSESEVSVDWLSNYTSGSWRQYKKWIKDMPDNYHPLDQTLVFQNTEVSRETYSSKKLPYPLEKGPCTAYEELMSTLYDEEERRKLEWAIGSVVSGDSRYIQKFLVLYGSAGAGKSTVLNIIQQLFEGYYTTFEASSLASSNNQFATEAFKSNPLVAIQHDGDLSKIQDNTKLNSIISHEEMTINEKYKSSYTSKIDCFLFMATNRPVKITDAKSGISRRLIDARPSGRKIEAGRYQYLVKQIKFELGAIAKHCLDVYELLGKNYYDAYRPIDMMFQTDVFFNFVEDSYFIFKKQDGCSLKQAYDLYKEYCADALVEYKMPKYKFREELKNYFTDFYDMTRINGKQIRNYYGGFKSEKFESVILPEVGEKEEEPRLELECTESIFDKECADCPAQYATAEETPSKRWASVTTKLSDIDTSRVHYVRVPENHIVIDFDLRGEDGEKSAKMNLEAAAKWPATYAEFSKGGAGVHLHYIYDGDVTKLSRLYSFGIEIKVFTGKSSLRRRLSKCNDLPIAHISSGLPLKGDKVINFTSVKSERGLRNLIIRNLRKEIHPGTKPSIDFIKKILNDAYESGLRYDVSDMYNDILSFAMHSTHQAQYCTNAVAQMKFKSDEPSEGTIDGYSDEKLVFFDIEVFPNLFLVNWKYEGEGSTCVRMINPASDEIEQLMKYKLVGFNCRRYDNHVLYARYLGYSNMELFNLSQKLINGDRGAFFGEAYNISYTDVYDFASAGNKKSLKKFEIELGIHHQELGLPWDQPVPEEKWEEVAEYCDNDVIATEAVFNHLQGDWKAREILADIAGMTVNDTTNSLTTRIIFGRERNPKLVYTNLATGEASDPRYQRNDIINAFPGYEFVNGKNMYRGVDVSKGGYVYAEPGMYTDVALLDVASLHPHSIVAMNCFGEYTKNFQDLMDARIFIKHGDYESAKKLFDGKLAPYLDDPAQAKNLAAALKTAINSVYGLTAATFDNPFHDSRNKNNIVALRGALFMKTLQDEVQAKGYRVIAIRTDSIKIANATQEIINFCMEFAKKYGYEFEHEATYDRICLVNDAVYIAHSALGDHAGEWTATGAQFAQPFVFKTLFSHEPIRFEDLCETRSVKTALYLDMNEGLTQNPEAEKELANREFNAKQTDPSKYRKLNPEFVTDTAEDLRAAIAKGHAYKFVGRVGQFCPIKDGCGGGLLVREKDGKYYAASNSKGYRWLESEMVKTLKREDDINVRYFQNLVDEAITDISEYGDFEWFASVDTDPESNPPWCTTPETKDPDISQCEKCQECDSCAVVNAA